MEQKSVKSNKKAFRIFYISNGFVTTVYKLKSTNGKQALQTFIKHHWNGKQYDLRRIGAYELNELEHIVEYPYEVNPSWYAVCEGFATLFSEELL